MAEEQELIPTETEGYIVGEKKTIEEYKSLDANDESLNKWKESLGLGQVSTAPTDDPRRVVILAMILEVDGEDKVVADVSTAEKAKQLNDSPMVIKEGVTYRLKVRFKVQHDVISGLKYLHVVKRKGIRVDRLEEMVGSYGPSDSYYEKKFMPEESPSGFLARGRYNVKSKFIDDDKVTHLEWDWAFEIKKEW
ncbi:Rho GDP-dissociation inhibitor [Zancudomyces culisetae]|uniref:Rho GDP-dissociation inhibitor n=1 Tax=Zancudomyces culisetae TaxID=1213189 RepID=A0A1R1PYB6_ZANCU|nr:Rho GDP-dissociation inhibitor [Zancudomyces culisetae]|eukprot:OMH85956.1 Rho GDP-dissociation inhibitor [Zancudomyces culisetae]